MESILIKVFTLMIVVLFLLGNLSNGFIVLMTCIDWVKKRKLSPVDQILLLLAISRMGLIWEILGSWLSTLHYSLSLVPETEVRIIILSWIVTNHFSLWFATILSIFYLLKIATFSRPIFLYLKWRIKTVILTIWLGTWVFLILNVIRINTHLEDWLHGLERNATWNTTVSDSAAFEELVIFEMTMFSLMPFTVALVSFLLLIFSLWKHLHDMQLHSKGHRDPRTKAHTNALKITISFLLLYSAYFLSLFIPWLFKTHQNRLVHILCLTFGLLYPSIHSFILILGNSKLRQAFLWVLRHLSCGI